MRNMRIFQSSRGRFTAAIQVTDTGHIYTTFALCGPNDRYVRRTGYDRVVGLFKSKQTPPMPLGVVAPGVDPVETVFKPWYAALSHLDTTAFADYDGRSAAIVNTLAESLTPLPVG